MITPGHSSFAFALTRRTLYFAILNLFRYQDSSSLTFPRQLLPRLFLVSPLAESPLSWVSSLPRALGLQVSRTPSDSCELWYFYPFWCWCQYQYGVSGIFSPASGHFPPSLCWDYSGKTKLTYMNFVCLAQSGVLFLRVVKCHFCYTDENMSSEFYP